MSEKQRGILKKVPVSSHNDYKEQKMASSNCVDNYLLVCYQIS